MSADNQPALRLEPGDALILLNEIDAVAIQLGMTFDDLPRKQQGAAIILSHSLAAMRRKLTSEGRSD